MGILRREKASISGTIDLAAEQLMPGLFKLTARIENETSLAKAFSFRREDALATRSFQLTPFWNYAAGSLFHW